MENVKSAPRAGEQAENLGASYSPADATLSNRPVGAKVLGGRPKPLELRGEAASAGRTLDMNVQSLWIPTLFFSLILTVVAAFLSTASYARQEAVSGQLVPAAGTPSVTSSRPGVVAQVYVRNGEAVKLGQPLVAISLDTVVQGGETAGGMIDRALDAQQAATVWRDEAERKFSAAEIESLAQRRSSLLNQLETTRAQAEFARERVGIAEERLERAKPLVKAGYVSRLQATQWEDALLQSRITLADIERQEIGLRQSLSEIGTERQQIFARLDQQRAQIAGSQAEMDEKRVTAKTQQQIILVSPRAGQIAALDVKVGAPVVAGADLAVVLPDHSGLQAELWLPSSAIGFIRAGDQVKLMYAAFPYEKFGMGSGQVVDISTAPLKRQDQSANGSHTEPLYAVKVRLDRQSVYAYGKEWPLVPGMQVIARVVLEKRSVIEWLLDPLLSITSDWRS